MVKKLISGMLAFLILCSSVAETNAAEEYIKWVEFKVPTEVMERAMKADIAAYESGGSMDWIELLAYVSAKNWGEFGNKQKVLGDLDALVKKIKESPEIVDIDTLAADLKLYGFYKKAYRAIIGAYVGEYEVINAETGRTELKYGLKAYSPIAQGYGYSHYDDFGVSRSFGYQRRHQGNDLMGSVGTPIIAVEDGYVEAIGWNRYGGWRIGIRSTDEHRYYYYAHLRKDTPYAKEFEVGETVRAGDVIGYLGMTGYSDKENVNNIKQPHLHFGVELIFDESQKDAVSQIWIDVYGLVRLLSKHRMPVKARTEGKGFERALDTNFVPVD